MEERGISQFDSSLKTPSRAKVSDCSLPCLRFLVTLLGMWSLYQMPRERAEIPTQALGLSLSNRVQIGGVHLIIGHGIMAPNH